MVQDWIIVMQHWLVCPKQLLQHYNVSRTQRLAWSSSWAVVNTSLHVWYSYTGFQCAGASSSNCVALCTLFHTGRVQRIWPTSSSPLVPAVHALVSVQHRWPNTCCRGCAQSSWNVRFRTQDCPHGTDYLKICALWQTQLTFENSWKLTFLLLLIMFTDICSRGLPFYVFRTFVMHLCACL